MIISVHPSLAAPETEVLLFSRRFFLGMSFAGLSSGTLARAVFAPVPAAGAENAKVAPSLFERALLALERHRDSITHRDFIGVADWKNL